MDVLRDMLKSDGLIDENETAEDDPFADVLKKPEWAEQADGIALSAFQFHDMRPPVCCPQSIEAWLMRTILRKFPYVQKARANAPSSG